MILREYQQSIVNKVISSNKNQIICLPTGSGKTVIGFEIIKELNNKNYTVIFIIPRIELINQAKKEFGEVDIIWSTKTKLTGKKCIIASKDSLINQFCKLNLDEKIVLFFDEVHIGIEQTYKLVERIKPQRVLGLTATPERMDGKALLKGEDKIHKFGCFDELIQEETVDSLIKKGYLCPLKYFTKPIDGIVDIKPDNANGEELSDDQITELFNKNQIWGDLVESYEKYGIENGIKRPALGFTNTIELAHKVAKIFNDSGYNFKVITGEMNIKEREKLIEDLATRKIDGLINAALLTYGFDCPPVSYAFSCRHIKSRPLWFQIVGRILRIAENKENAIFVDHGDSISEFAEPNCSLPILDPDIKWRVNGEDKVERQKRKKAQKKERDSLKILQELDPQPCNMVEVKPEDTWERMIKVLQKLKNENEGLLQFATKVRKENEQLKHEIKVIEQTKTKARKFVDEDKTFNFIRKNYCYIRNEIKSKFWNCPSWQNLSSEERREKEHEETVKKLKSMENIQTFLFDKRTFERGCNYWKNNYVEKFKYN